MKILQATAMIFCLSVLLNAQIDCSVTNKVFIRDFDGNIVNSAKIELFRVEKNFNRIFAFSPKEIKDDAHLITSYTGTLLTDGNNRFHIGENYWMKVSAENYKSIERPIKFERCKAQEITVRLEKINQKIKLTGIVYDTNGAIVVGAIVTATDSDGKSYGTLTNDEGIYLFELLPATYKLYFEQAGFEKTVLENFQLVNSTYGKVNQDIVLNVNDNWNCGAGGCIKDDSQPVKTANEKVSDKVILKPPVKMPED